MASFWCAAQPCQTANSTLRFSVSTVFALHISIINSIVIPVDDCGNQIHLNQLTAPGHVIALQLNMQRYNKRNQRCCTSCLDQECVRHLIKMKAACRACDTKCSEAAAAKKEMQHYFKNLIIIANDFIKTACNCLAMVIRYFSMYVAE